MVLETKKRTVQNFISFFSLCLVQPVKPESVEEGEITLVCASLLIMGM